SPDLLDSFLRAGSRRFIFEGNECGGHIGPRSSFVLWEEMIAVLLDHIDNRRVPGSDCHVVFAGGIHDARSAAMVAVLAAALTKRGVKIGVSMGTAYLFTREAVASGAIVEGFQQQALECDHTAILELSPGHVIRSTDSPFVEAFGRERDALLDTDLDRTAIADALEEMVVGRLRLASKGIKRIDDTDGTHYVEAPSDEQHAEGFFMIGQVAALHEELVGMADLHENVARGGTMLLQAMDGVEEREETAPEPCDIAIIGMSAIYPGAPNFHDYWRNILNRVDAITEVPTQRFNLEQYYDPDRLTNKDRTYSRWGGFLAPIPLDPLRYGMPPNSMPSIDTVQLLALEAARLALEDAGYAERPFDRENTSVFVGAGGYGGGDLGTWYGFRAGLPGVFGDRADEVVDGLGTDLPTWTEDSFAGVLPNVIAGRIANRFNLGGTNMSVDAACASSLASIAMACRELQTGIANVVIAGGADTTQNPLAYIFFSRTQAFSPTGHCRAFDEDADGTTTAEGAGMVVLKRLADAERDGDRVYAVIKGVGGSSDGRDKGLTAPRAEGQVRALRRAYAQAGVSPATVELVEAHGTGTIVGDRTEVQALTQFWSERGAATQSCALGSVKSMIGHSKCAAGVAGLIKTTLALHEKVLPPTLHVRQPNSQANFPATPFYVNTEARPWVHSDEHPRRAGVSAFGFGGTNFHVVLEEYRDGIGEADRSVLDGPGSELLIWTSQERTSLLDKLASFDAWLAQTDTSLASIARAICEAADPAAAGGCRMAIVATSVEDLREKLAVARSGLHDPSRSAIDDRHGIYYSEGRTNQNVAFLYSGQGSQYPNMGRDLALHLCAVRETFERADAVLDGCFEGRLSSRIFPVPAFTPEETRAQREALIDTRIAQPALGALAIGLTVLLNDLGVEPSMVAGHSYGEFAALWAAGVFDTDDLLRISEARGRAMAGSEPGERGTMAAAAADAETVTRAIEGIDGLVAANVNSPRQTVISGTRDAVERGIEALAAAGVQAKKIDVACAFHSREMMDARDTLAATLTSVTFSPPRIPVYSNTTAGAYPEGKVKIRALLVDHMVRPVLFAPEIEAMYDAGARIFVEIGPNGVLTNLTGQILGERPHLAISLDAEGQDGMRRLQQALARLFVEGIGVNAAKLFNHRDVPAADLTAGPVPLSPSTWLVDGGISVPINKPELRRERHPIELPVREVPVPAAAAPASAPTERTGTAAVVTQFQDVMTRFLETQEAVMRAYLGAPTGTSTTPQTAPRAVAPAPPVAPGSPAPAVETPKEEVATVVDTPVESEVVVTREVLTERLLAAVAERTGYPPEMLTLDADLEADLGIDSIKRVEILVGFQDQLSESGTLGTSAIDELARIRTLGGIIDWAMAQSGEPAPSEAQSEPAMQLVPVDATATAGTNGSNGKTNGHSNDHVDATREVHRATLNLVDRPLPKTTARLGPGTVLITDDGRGIAAALAGTFRESGRSVAHVEFGEATGVVDDGSYTCPFDEDGVRRLVDLIHDGGGAVAALVHLLPVRSTTNMTDPIEIRKRIAQDVEGLFLLAREFGADLHRAAENGGAAVL
ncbi:MAG TPA: beta-ketoacyl synthase N-terminal-like domain-containing protein, partial [Chloroflexota bacterium]|nr:beta-ketoacyl synthase N-terminal-like domain-containing protein [Chloroflexota bacterium]